MIYTIRPMHPEEYPLLTDFLYEAIYQRDETQLLPKTIVNNQELQVYIKDFGLMKDDWCFCAEVARKIVGAVWVRNIEGYGSVGDGIPEFAISLYKPYRGYGIGTAMMEQMLKLLGDKGYKRASLAVQKDNYAFRMYQKADFQTIDENEEEYIMEYVFQE